MADYRIDLGVGLNQSQLNQVKQVLESIENQKRDVIYNVDFNIKNASKLTEVSKEIEKIQTQLNSVGSGKNIKAAIPIDSKSIETTLNKVNESIKKIRNSLGTVDSKKGVQSLLTTVNKINTALDKVSKQFADLNRNLTNLSSKDFSLNFDFGFGNSSKNPEQALKELKMLQKEVEEYEKYFRKFYSMGASEANVDPINRLIFQHNQRKQVYGLQLQEAMGKGSNVQKIAAYKQYLNLIKETASIGRISLEPVEFRLAESGEFIKVRNEVDETQQKLKELFSGGINAENLHRTLSEIADDLKVIKESLAGVSSEADSPINQLTQSFNKLSEYIEKLVSNAALVKNVLGDGLTNTTNVETSAINKIEKASDDSTAAVIQNEKKKQEVYKATADAVVYHAGVISKLNKAETNGRFYGSNRGTGYFGTGHYFVDSATKHELDNDNYYNKMPYTSVDISQYDNLFKATTDEVAEKLHSFLGNLTRFTQGADDYDISELFAQFKSVFGDTIMDIKEFGSRLDQLKAFMSSSSLDDRSDSVSTQFMKSLGYEGVDTRGTRFADTRYGTVIYDLKEESILQANITDELQKQGQMLEKINYAKGQAFDKDADARIQSELDAQAKKREIAEEFQNSFDTTNLNKANSDLDAAQSRLKKIDDIIFDLQKGIDNAEQDVQRFAREMAEFGIDMSDEEIREQTQNRVKDYRESINELSQEKAELQSQIPILEEVSNRENQLANEAYEKAKQTVEQRHLEAQQAQESANAVVQAEERKQQAYQETTRELSELQKYYKKYYSDSSDKSNDARVKLTQDRIVKQLTNPYNESTGIMRRITQFTDPSGISQKDLDYFSAVNAELKKIGYTLGEIQWDKNSYIAGADIIPIDDNAIQSAEEMRNILYGLESQGEKVAQVSAQSANAVIQDEERKQQSYRETADAYEKISRDTSLVRDDADFQKVFEASNQAAQEAQRHFQELLADEKAVVSVTEQFDNGNTLQSFIVNIKRASGEVETLRYAIDKLNDEENENFRYQGASASDGKVEKQLEKHIKKANDLQIKLEKIKSGYSDMGAAKPIKELSHIESLDEQYKKVEKAIIDVRNADDSTFSSMLSNAEKEKAALENMVREYRNAENVATSLRSKDISTAKDTYSSKLDVLVSKMKSSGVYTDGFEKGAENLRTVLSDATDASGLVKFLNGLDKLEAGYKRADAAAKEFNKSQKVGINTSGLESKIADIQRISPEIDKFEAEIDGAKVSVQSLLNNLKQVKTQSDFSTVNARFKAFKDAAQAAGIAVAETAQKAKSINDIKIKLSDTGFNGFEQEVLRVRNATEELEGVYPDLEAALQRLDAAMEGVYSADQAGDVKRLVAANEEYEAALKQVYSQLKLNQEAEQKAYKAEILNQKKSALSSEMETWLKENTRAARDFGEEIRRLQASLNGLDDKGVKLVGQQFKSITKQAQAMGKTGLTAFDKLKSKVKEYMTYLSAAEMFMYAEQAFRSMFEQVKLIDSAMTELKKVTDETDASYNKFLSNAASRSKELGTTIDGLVSSTADFARLGYGFKDAQGLAEVANIYAVVGDEIEGVEGATESLVSTIAAFKDELSGVSDTDFAMDIIDKFNEVSNNFAISSGGIGEAMQRSASSLRAANNTIDESIALITAAM